MEFAKALKLVRSALYVPASNARALEKAKGLAADMLILDLEDSVPEDAKADARVAAIAATQAGFPGKLVALRTNSPGTEHFDADLEAANACRLDAIVLPKIDATAALDGLPQRSAFPALAMIESPAGVYAAKDIASLPFVAGLLAGMNDFAAETGIRPGPQRQGLELALQAIVLAATFAGKPAFDSVSNQLDDMTGFEAECAQGRCYGYTGKTLIHPNQVPITNTAFGPSQTELAEAHALIAAATGGAQRMGGRMIESMHVEEARRTIERARHGMDSTSI